MNRDEIKLIQNEDGKFELYEFYATVDYRTEEDFMFAKNAIEKQIPQKPTIAGAYGVCPNCNKFVSQYEQSHGNLTIPFCKWCGQALDWGDDNA